jgi:putative transposase
MKGKRKQHTAAFKAQVALATLKGDKTVNELASQYGVHPTLIHGWKKQLLGGADQIFRNGTKAAAADAEADKAELFEQIGRLKMELEWLKKKLEHTPERLRPLIEADHAELSVRRQCALLGLCRSSLYDEPATATAENLRLMRLLDQEYTAHPFLGSRRLTQWLIAEQGEEVNRKRGQRLMRLMGLEAIYPKPKLSAAGRGHQGVQFTAQAWTGRLEAAGVAVSRDSKRRCLDNVFVERLWRTVKYEDIYLRGYETVPQLQEGLGRYFPYYNAERLHQSLEYRTPAAVYQEGRGTSTSGIFPHPATPQPR